MNLPSIGSKIKKTKISQFFCIWASSAKSEIFRMHGVTTTDDDDRFLKNLSSELAQNV